MRKTRRALVLITAFATVAVSAGMTATSQARTATTMLCDHNAHLQVHGPDARLDYEIRNPYWRGRGPLCIRNIGGRANFAVTRTPSADPDGKVVAYPAIMRGCYWNACSPHAGIPIQASAIHHLTSTWHTTEHAPGTWNASYDIWFGKHPQTQGHADGAELMIWLNHHGTCCWKPDGSPIVRVGAHRYWLVHWRAYDTTYGVGWNYIQFRMVHPTWQVNHLRIKLFIQRAIRLGLIKPTWWMENVEAGFEIWNGGRGLTTTTFKATVR